MKKFPTTFAAMIMILLIMFFFISSLMKNAEKDLKKLDEKRRVEGGGNEYEKQLDMLLK